MSYEKNIPTEQDKKKKITRVSCKNGDQGWTQGFGTQKTERQMEPVCLNFSFTKEMHVKKRWEFSQLRRNGQKFYGRFLCFQYTPLTASEPKLGLTVSKKYGGAVQRNLFKRKNKELFRTLHLQFLQTVSINILPLIHSKNATYSDLKKDWEKIITHLNKGMNDKNKAQPLAAQSL